MLPSLRSVIYNRLNTKIIIYFLAFAFLPLLLFSIFGYYLNKDLLTGINIAQLRALNKSSAKEVETYLHFKKHILKHSFDDFRNTEDKISLYEHVYQYNLNDSDFFRVELADQYQRINVISEQTTDGENTYLIPVVYQVNDFIIVGYLKVEKFRKFLQNDLNNMQNIVYFLKFGKKITPDIVEDLTEEEEKWLYSNLEGVQTVEKQDDIHDAEYVEICDWVVRNEVVFCSRVAQATFYTELIRFRNEIIVANIFFGIILIALAIIYSNRITTPLRKLIKATQQIGQGKLDRNIEVSTNDEIQILAKEFELMRIKLQESYQGMEEKIEKRTRELQQAQAQISHQEKMASLGMMAAGIAHEIGNPLTSISSMVQVIKRKSGDDQINAYVSNILKNIERISRIVREMVDFSRPSSLDAAPTDVNEVVRSAVGIMRYDRRSKNLDYSLTLDEKLPKTVVVSDHLLQVFLNILINAVDACEGFGNEISVKTLSQNSSIYVVISDEGCGIAPDEKNKIFEPFFTTKGVGKGTGLGLTVSYGLIKKMKGEIRVDSELGKGSTFSVVIPIKSSVED